MAVAYVKSGSGVTEFAQSTAYSVGNRIVPLRLDVGSNHLTAKRWVWECTTAGTSAAANPTWPASVTQDTTTVTSGTAIFTARRPGFSSGTTANWSYATIYLDYPWGIGGLNAAGDICYVSNNHSENGAGTYWQTNGNTPVNFAFAICVYDDVAPPTTEVTTPSAVVQVPGSPNQTSASWHARGINFQGNASYPYFSGIYENCNFIYTGGTANSAWSLGFAKNCGIKFSAATQSVSGQFAGGSILPGGTSPTYFFGQNGGLADGFDFSNASSTMSFCNNLIAGARAYARRVKLPAGWSGSVVASTPQGYESSCYFELIAVDLLPTNFMYRKKTIGGETFSETVVAKPPSEENGYKSLSYKLVGGSSASFPLRTCSTPDLAKWNEIVNTPITVSVDILHDGAANLTNSDCWLEVSYFASADSTLATYASSQSASVIATPTDLPVSTSSWTTVGLAAPNKQKLSITITPTISGYIMAKVFLAKASKTIYVDPLLTIS